eukprot:CAMPEP_0170407188 /NCGR_PEP_ID=MMETSP0117_2-20130122/28114_1 /TAXON_ID=400756 /ORGANISM="Durinskia baltica, Strain CSIRO CS-38" /LENGTH=1170 /DNA_ID=CAMNT_0010664419 /DNA_START=122 /DNA_END=3634 /DNA_ORIENTATION=+
MQKLETSALAITPIFHLKKFDWNRRESKLNPQSTSSSPPILIQDVAVSNNIVIIATTGGVIMRWNANDAGKEPERIDISGTAVNKLLSNAHGNGDSIEHVFIDPTSNHVIVTMKSMDNYYLHSRSHKAKKLTRLQGVLESVAFDRHNCTESATRSFLAGTSSGVIYELSIDSSGKEKICQPVYQLDQPLAITSLYFDTIGRFRPNVSGGNVASSSNPASGVTGGSSFTAAASSLGNSNGNSNASSTATESRMFVLWCTTSPTRLYHLTGGPTLLALFSSFLQSGSTSFTEVPMRNVEKTGMVMPAVKRVKLICRGDDGATNGSLRRTSAAQYFALMTDVGLYHGYLLFSNGDAEGSEKVIVEAYHSLYSEPSLSQVTQFMSPVSIAISSYHFIVLRPGVVQMFSNLSGDLMQEDFLQTKTDGVALALVHDPVRPMPWLITTTSIYQVTATDEDRYLWRLYLNRAITTGDDQLFELAITFSKQPSERTEIMRARASSSLVQGKFHLGAIYFAQSDLSFDEVALSLLLCSIPNSSYSNSISLSLLFGEKFYILFVPVVKSNILYLAHTSDFGAKYRGLSYCSSLLVDAVISQGCALAPLNVYLLQVLSSLATGAKMQRTMLSAWLCDLYLHQINLANISHGGNEDITRNDNQMGVAVRSDCMDELELTNQFMNFFRSNKSCLELCTTLSLINSRNHANLVMFHAQIIGDYHKVVTMNMYQGFFSEAIAILSNAPIGRVADLIYKTAPVLILQEPEATVHMFLTKSHLSISSLLPALLSYCSALDNQHGSVDNEGSTQLGRLDRDFEGKQVNFAVLFLKAILARQGFFFGAQLPATISLSEEYTNSNYEASSFHTIIWMLARYDSLEHEQDEQELVALLTCLQVSKAQTTILNYLNIDFGYILRQCRLHGRHRACVHALLLLECPTEAISEALLLNIHDAKQLVHQLHQLGSSIDILRELWMNIARVVVDQESDMAVPIALLQESGGILTIDDLLPHLPNFTEMELFQEEICLTLENCGEHIYNLKGQMKELVDSAESTVQELECMKNRAYSMVAQVQLCEYCSESLLGKVFYLFPCSHGFHCQCLVQRCAQLLTPVQVNAVRGVEELLRGLVYKGKDLNMDRRVRAQQEALQLELDGYIAADCPLCGYMMIQSLSQPLISDSESGEINIWII